MAPTNGRKLDLDRCPYCGIAKPYLYATHGQVSKKGDWHLYHCSSCGGMVMTLTPLTKTIITEMWPPAFSVSEEVPQRAREFLKQAAASLHAPAGALMLTARAVDAMLKDKGYKDGVRTNAAAKDHLITAEMAAWAHEIRLDANDQRHADELAPLPNEADARRSLDFGQALAQFIYVLPAMVALGRNSAIPPRA